jgi:hypothetical protein
MVDDEETVEVVTSWSGIWVTALVSSVQGLLFYAFFAYERKKESVKDSYDLYEPRQHTRRHRSPPPFEESWWKATLAVTDEETLKCVGLDSYMFLRFLRLGARISALGVLLSVVLLPVYATGNARGAATEQFNLLTLARVEAGSNRIWASAIAWWIFCLGIGHEFWNEWQLYKVNRYVFLKVGDVDMPKEFRYAIQVEQVPQVLQSEEALAQYFERLFPGNVKDTTIFLKADTLQKLIAERQVNITKLEGAIAFTMAKPDKPRPQVAPDAKMGCIGGTKVDAIKHYEKEIERLNKEIDQERIKFLGQADTEKAECSIVASSTVANAATSEDVEVLSSIHSDKTTLELISTTSTAIVTFTSLRAKQASIQCELTGDPDSMIVKAAPDPNGILWNNVTVSLPQQTVFQAQAALLWIAGVLFWAVPVSFVTSIANLNSILEAVGLNQADPTVFWYGLVSGLLPVIALAILMAVLYMAIVAIATSWIRFKSMPEVDAYSLYWHQLFQFANLWLILIGGSAFNQIDGLIDDPTAIVQIMATALPGASTFFVNMILVASMGQFGLELSMIPTYGLTLVMKLIQPEAMRTQRQLDTSKKPPCMVWGQRIPPAVFIFLVAVLYMPIVPIMEVFAFVYFAGSYIVWKHQFLHVYAQDFEGGGDVTWQQLFGFLMASLYMGQVVFIAYMGIKEAVGPSIMGIVPLVGTIIMHRWLDRKIIKPLKNLSLEVAANEDIDAGELEQLHRDIELEHGSRSLYKSPALDTEKEERGAMPYRRDQVNQEKPTQEKKSPSEQSMDREPVLLDEEAPAAPIGEAEMDRKIKEVEQQVTEENVLVRQDQPGLDVVPPALMDTPAMPEQVDDPEKADEMEEHLQGEVAPEEN